MPAKNDLDVYKILDALDKGSIEWSLFYFGVERDPGNYAVERKERRETKTVGRDRIPRKGDILACHINDYFAMQHESFRQEFPELTLEGNSGVVDIVDDVIPAGDKAMVVIGRYVFREK